MNIRMYQSEDCREIVELFYNTVHSINSRDYNNAQLDVWASKEIDIDSWINLFHNIILLWLRKMMLS